MTTDNKPKKIAELSFIAPDGGGRGVVYGINRKGKHVILETLPAGMDITGGNIFRFDTIEEARECWKLVVKRIKAAGCVPEEEYMAAMKLKYPEVWK